MKAERAEQIRSLAEELADLYCPEGPVDPLKVLEAGDITVSFNYYGDAFDGALEHRSGRFHAYCNLDRVTQKNSARARFTLAHELGHYYLDEHRTALERGLAPMHGSFCNRPDSELVVEQEADLFASHFLLPRPRYGHFLESLPARPAGLHKIVAVANRFDVSVQAAAIRYCQGITATCGIVMWRKGDPSWSYVAPHWEAAGYPRLRRDPEAICSGSATSTAIGAEGGGRFGKIEESTTTAAFWFPRVAAGGSRDVILIEQAVKLGSYGVLTLLSVQT